MAPQNADPQPPTSAMHLIAVRLDRLPPSRQLWRIVLLVSLAGVFEFYDLFFTAYVGPGMVASGLFTRESLGPIGQLAIVFGGGPATFVFSTFAGLYLGALLFGSLPDRWGRRRVLTAALLWYSLATLIMALQRTGFALGLLAPGVRFGTRGAARDHRFLPLGAGAPSSARTHFCRQLQPRIRSGARGRVTGMAVRPLSAAGAGRLALGHVDWSGSRPRSVLVAALATRITTLVGAPGVGCIRQSASCSSSRPQRRSTL